MFKLIKIYDSSQGFTNLFKLLNNQEICKKIRKVFLQNILNFLRNYLVY